MKQTNLQELDDLSKRILSHEDAPSLREVDEVTLMNAVSQCKQDGFTDMEIIRLVLGELK